MTTRIVAPPSKSISHRAFLLAALSAESCTVTDALLGADTQATLAAVAGLGARFEVDEREPGRGDVHFAGFALQAPQRPIDCANSGTTLRLLAGQVARFDFPVTLIGDESLRGRKSTELLEALGALDAAVESHEGCAPLQIQGPIRAGEVHLPAGVSSQYASSLLLALAQVDGRSRLTLALPIASRPYLDLTLDVASSFGLRFVVHDGEGDTRFEIPGGQRPGAAQITVEGDWSAAAFPLVAGAILGRSVSVSGLRANSVQGDRVIQQHLESFGAQLTWNGDALSIDARALSSPGLIDVVACPDLFPALCVLAACSKGTTTLHGAPGLRNKECDRISAMAAGLTTMGIVVEERPDGLTVTGGARRGAAIRSHGDHRIHMAFQILGLATPEEMTIDHPGSVAVSYPSFHQDLFLLRAAVPANPGD